jgi:hypothetical protein
LGRSSDGTRFRDAQLWSMLLGELSFASPAKKEPVASVLKIAES